MISSSDSSSEPGEVATLLVQPCTSFCRFIVIGFRLAAVVFQALLRFVMALCPSFMRCYATRIRSNFNSRGVNSRELF